MKCNVCNHELSDATVKFCPFCGAPVVPGQVEESNEVPTVESLAAEESTSNNIESAVSELEEATKAVDDAADASADLETVPTVDAIVAPEPEVTEQPTVENVIATELPPQQDAYYNNNTNTAYNQGGDVIKSTLISEVATLVFGILSIGLSYFPITSIVGIIFGAISINNAKKYEDEMRSIGAVRRDGRVKAGKITGIIGLIFSIIVTVIYVFVIMLSCFGVMMTYSY